MRTSLAIILCFSLSADGFNSFDSRSYKGLAMGALVLASVVGQAMGQNCTAAPPDPYYLSDAQTELYNYWQLGAAGFAIILIAGNFPSAYFFYRRQQRNFAAALKEYIDAITTDNDELREAHRYHQSVLQAIRRKYHTRESD